MHGRMAAPVPNLLNLPDYRIITVDETDDAYHIAAETLVAPRMCSHCDGTAIVGYGRAVTMDSGSAHAWEARGSLFSNAPLSL